MMEPNPAKLAILIDAENVLPSHAELIFSTAEAMGDVVAKEIFGVAAALTTWVEPVLRYAIHPNLTIKASKGKNTSDIALVIGAMDLLLKGEVNTVVIASSDSDFSTLSVRLRTAGIRVVGMGTEKSNALWRTACSSFIVLEHPAQQPKQQAQKQAQQAAKQPPKQQAQKQPPQQPQPQPAEAPAPQAQPPKATASATHEERAAAIQQVILKRLASNGGRVQVGTLFTALNRMPEYRADRQGSGRKPLNYLTSTFSDVFDFEDSADGKIWVSVKGPADEAAAPADAAPEAEVEVVETVEAEAPAAVVETPEAEEPAVEETVVEVEEVAEVEETEAPAVEAEPEPEPEVEPVPEQAGEAPQADEPQSQQDDVVSAFVERLIADGMDPEVARDIARILSESENLRTAYNTLRKEYGNAGRDYYNRAKAVLNTLQG